VIDVSLMFVLSVFLTVGPLACYSVGMISLRVFGLVAGPAICMMIAAVVIGPPSAPLTCEEMAKQKAQGDGFVVGLATGMMMPRCVVAP
jgi:hypothetical protein